MRIEPEPRDAPPGGIVALAVQIATNHAMFSSLIDPTLVTFCEVTINRNCLSLRTEVFRALRMSYSAGLPSRTERKSIGVLQRWMSDPPAWQERFPGLWAVGPR